MASCDCALLGIHGIYMEDRATGATKGYFEVGNNSDGSISGEENEITLTDFTSKIGGNCAQSTELSSITFEATLYDFCPKNLQVVGRGGTTTVAAGAVADAALVAWPGNFVRFDVLPDEEQTLTVTGTGGTPTYVEGTDYIRTFSGLFLPSGTSIGNPSDNTTPNIEVDYTGLSTDTTQFFTLGAKEYIVVLDGYNKFNSQPYQVVIHRFKPGLLSAFPTNSQEAASYTMSGEILRDTSIVGAGVSQYFLYRQVTKE